jgi:hypothetical protein
MPKESTKRNVRIRYTRDSAWPKGAEVIVREDRVPAEAQIVSYETGEPYVPPKPRKPAKRRTKTTVPNKESSTPPPAPAGPAPAASAEVSGDVNG